MYTRNIHVWVLIVCLGVVTTAARAADHREAPLIQEDGTADIADVYVFLSPEDETKMVLAMTVNPFSVPGEAVTYHFSPNVRYRFNIDNTGDAIADITYNFTFSPRSMGGQQFVVTGLGANGVVGMVTPPTEGTEPNPPIITDGPGGARIFAGPREDPFFFDLVGFFRFLDGSGGFSGADTFAGFNVSAIVIEVPVERLLGDAPTLQVWADTARRQTTIRRSDQGLLEVSTGPFQQIERMGNPAVATALIPSGLKDLYNIGVPADDFEHFAGSIVASLRGLGTDDTSIGILASVAVPDTIKISPDAPTEFPNGRALDDDVIDTLFFFIFNRVETPDGVDANDRAFLDAFPYLASPNQPE